MITKRLLDAVVAYEQDITTDYYKAHDIFTLHFLEWWRKKLVIRIPRIISEVNKEEGTFMHRTSEQCAAFSEMLTDHVNKSYQEAGEKQVKERCTVLKLVPAGKEE